jgi:xylan 1,4-beta-xylosidase
LDKPVLNVFRMFGMLGTARIRVESSGAIATDAIVSKGVTGKPDIQAIATLKGGQLELLVWNYHDDDVAACDALIDLVIENLPVHLPASQPMKVLVEHFRVDGSHSNAFAAWKQMGSPQDPSPAQYQRLESAGQLQLLQSPAWVGVERGPLHVPFTLPRQGVSLLRCTW